MLDMPVKIDCPVVSVGEWQRAHPIELNRAAPFRVEGVGVAGVAGAVKRMKAAKFTMSDDISETVPIGMPKFGLRGLGFSRFEASSGEPLKTQPATAFRSLGKFSLETPCSTL